MNISDWQTELLADLHQHWGEVFLFRVSGDTWSASPRLDQLTILTDDTADGLRQQVRAYYGEHPELHLRARDHTAVRCWCGESHTPAQAVERTEQERDCMK